jgi:hypothetical protein
MAKAEKERSRAAPAQHAWEQTRADTLANQAAILRLRDKQWRTNLAANLVRKPAPAGRPRPHQT